MARTVPDLLFACVDRDPDQLAVFWPEGGVFLGMTRMDSAREVARLARGLADLGVGKGTVVAIVAETRKEWAHCDLALLCLGAITIGIYPTLLREQVAYQLAHSEARIALVEDAEQAAKVAAIRDQVPALQHVVTMEPVEGHPSLVDVACDVDLDWLRARAAQVGPDDVATYIYTSGTTGPPKAAILTHGNFVAVSEATLEIANIGPADRALVWLPLAHALQRFTVYRGLLEDGVGYFAESIEKLPEALVGSRPTVLATVPRMMEKVRDRALSAVQARGPLAKRIFEWAFAVGHAHLACREERRPVPLGLRLQWRVADRLVFRHIKARMGGALRLLICGGAALNPDVARWFAAMGITVLEGWGLTETCAPATLNRETDFRFGTVGKPIPGVSIRIAEDGEVLVKSPGTFQGYFKDPEATAAVFSDGWFHTGDIGFVDEDGFLVITDRKKEILVTSGGKNIGPVNIEQRLERSPYVGQAVAIGSERPYLVALLVPDAEALEALARRAGLPDEPLGARLQRTEVEALFQDAVREANRELAQFETVKCFAVLPTAFSVETGELTPTLKLKRRVVSEKYAAEIEALYA
ncbi:MAG: long-chain fatty acid--CoA ligase [Deltaproteobacteria bacterium]|nr:long-chain fatty acid--CoA ligase [Deltaproteobacteria bacterium]